MHHSGGLQWGQRRSRYGPQNIITLNFPRRQWGIIGKLKQAFRMLSQCFKNFLFTTMLQPKIYLLATAVCIQCILYSSSFLSHLSLLTAKSAPIWQLRMMVPFAQWKLSTFFIVATLITEALFLIHTACNRLKVAGKEG